MNVAGRKLEHQCQGTSQKTGRRCLQQAWWVVAQDPESGEWRAVHASDSGPREWCMGHAQQKARLLNGTREAAPKTGENAGVEQPA